MIQKKSLSPLAFSALVAVALRYVSEYLRLLGARAWLVGLFGSAALALPFVVPTIRTNVRDVVDSRPSLVLGSLSVGGGLLWLSAPYFGAISLGQRNFGPWVWVLVGLLFLCLPRLETGGLVESIHAPGDPTERGWSGAKRRVVLIGAVGIAVGLFAGAPDFLPGYQVLVALAATLGVVATVVSGLRDESGGSEGRFRTFTDPPSISDVRSALHDVPPRLRSVLIGDALVQFAVGMVAYFLVVAVVHHHRLHADLLVVEFPPEATFGLLLAVETAVALFGTPVTTWLAETTSAKTVVAGGLLSVSLVPLSVINVPRFGVAFVSFAFLGGYLACRPTRERLVGTVARTHDLFDTYRVARRGAVVPAPLLGGMLYGFNPEFAFGFASCVGLLGCWEFLHSIRGAGA
ncbi:hypothetical protein A4G99_20410 [Haladaptatus sp. R4]|uniref:hypothetical protein n=1 Tax=Haladaptatus sp. R4 TaxID=1679489 RepID=UPI0007B4B3C9|nr:hypothetical protein [Haladaptatus sp. R4]KZN26424.1 hypothetical protein A4G99_20410 [Haladaptatus sp. R4]